MLKQSSASRLKSGSIVYAERYLKCPRRLDHREVYSIDQQLDCS